MQSFDLVTAFFIESRAALIELYSCCVGFSWKSRENYAIYSIRDSING